MSLQRWRVAEGRRVIVLPLPLKLLHEMLQLSGSFLLDTRRAMSMLSLKNDPPLHKAGHSSSST
jgi:hypothetical protein